MVHHYSTPPPPLDLNISVPPSVTQSAKCVGLSVLEAAGSGGIKLTPGGIVEVTGGGGIGGNATKPGEREL